MALAKFTKQPAETQDYDIDFVDYLEFHNDLPLSFSVTAGAGLVVASAALMGSAVKIFVTGGEDGEEYKVSATLTTQGGRVKQGDILIRVKEA